MWFIDIQAGHSYILQTNCYGWQTVSCFDSDQNEMLLELSYMIAMYSNALVESLRHLIFNGHK